MMQFENIEELLGAYALDAVDDDERAVVERYLQSHPRARAEVAGHQEVATLLAFTGAPAPEGLWDRIAASLGDEAPPEPGPELAKVLPLPAGDRPVRTDPRSAPVPPPPRSERTPLWRRPIVAAAAVAAVAAAVIVPLGVTVRDQDRELDRLPDSAVQVLYEEAQAAPGARRVELASPDGTLRVPAVVSADGSGFLDADALPPLDESSTYQLWAILPDRLVSLGVLGADPTLTAFRTDLGTGDTATLALTAERAGGVTATEQTPLATAPLA